MKLPSLAYMRTREDIIEINKILFEKYEPEISNFIQLRVDSFKREHNGTVSNGLPDRVVEANTVRAFEADSNTMRT